MSKKPEYDFESTKSVWLRLPSGRTVQVPRDPSEDLIDVLNGVEETDLTLIPDFAAAVGLEGATPRPGPPGGNEIAAPRVQLAQLGPSTFQPTWANQLPQSTGDTPDFTLPSILDWPSPTERLDSAIRAKEVDALTQSELDRTNPGWRIYAADEQDKLRSQAGELVYDMIRHNPDWREYSPEETDYAMSDARYRANYDQNLAALRDGIGGAEMRNDDRRFRFGSYYDIPYNFGSYLMPDKPLTEMTLAEVDQYQTNLGRAPGNAGGNTPVGKYQFNQGTLTWIAGELGLPSDQIFDAQTQDMMADWLLNFYGLDDYQAGRITGDEFQMNLVPIWASIPHPASGQALQNTGISTEGFQRLLEPLLPPSPPAP